MKKKILNFPSGMEEVKGMVKLGGYYKWDWKFPFRHFVKEELQIITKSGIYKIEV